jgi:hydrogenase maturation protease
VIGLGGAAAGDDGVGLAVLDALRAARVPPGVELMKIAEPTALVDLVEGVGLAVLVDAVVGAVSAGELVVIDARALEHGGARPLSSHGVDVVSALALARAIHGAAAPREVWIVGVGVSRVDRGTVGLSPAVTAAVPRAVDAVLACLARRPRI